MFLLTWINDLERTHGDDLLNSLNVSCENIMIIIICCNIISTKKHIISFMNYFFFYILVIEKCLNILPTLICIIHFYSSITKRCFLFYPILLEKNLWKFYLIVIASIKTGKKTYITVIYHIIYIMSLCSRITHCFSFAFKPKTDKRN